MLKHKNAFFGASEIEFLGYRIDADGILPSKTKVEVIWAASYPKNKINYNVFL